MDMDGAVHTSLPLPGESQANLMDPYIQKSFDEQESEGSLDLSRPDKPPSLQYDIASKKSPIVISMSMVVVINGIFPMALYYILHYATNLDAKTVINILQIPLTLILIHWPWRLWKLLRKNGERAPRDRTALTWDTFQWGFLTSVVPVTILCVISSMTGSLRWLALAHVLIFALVAVQLVITAFMSKAGVLTPCRLSSQQPGTPARPAVYSLIEDITACDGAGGQAYRERLNVRYESSPPFRKLVYDLSLYPGIGFLVMTGGQVVLIMTTKEEVFFGISTVLLWGWAGLMGWWGVSYAKTALRNEKVWWAQRMEKGGLNAEP